MRETFLTAASSQLTAGKPHRLEELKRDRTAAPLPEQAWESA
jgi:hypothetical protein